MGPFWRDHLSPDLHLPFPLLLSFRNGPRCPGFAPRPDSAPLTGPGRSEDTSSRYNSSGETSTVIFTLTAEQEFAAVSHGDEVVVQYGSGEERRPRTSAISTRSRSNEGRSGGDSWTGPRRQSRLGAVTAESLLPYLRVETCPEPVGSPLEPKAWSFTFQTVRRFGL